MTPLPAGTLFTETQSGLDVTWTTYNITVTINGTNFPVSFNAGDTRAVVIEKVPVGASLSASATIGVPENLGYPGNAFSAATTSPITIQSGSNTITMWAQYPLECQMSSDAAGAGAAITGTAPSCYTNASSTPLPAASASYEDSSTTPATTMRFTGWSFTDGGVPGITSTSIPANVYKGKLSLYATYSECSLTITGATPPGSGGDPILLPDDTLSLTAVAEGFPAGSAVTYSWRIVPPATGTAPATVSGSGASAVVHPVAGAAGSATVEVTASTGTLSATAQLNIDVKVCLPGFTVTISPPAGYVAAKSDETDPSNPSFALTDAAGAFSFTPVPEPGKSFPAGTTFSWDISVFSGASYGVPTPNTAVNEDASLNFESAHIPLGYTPTNAASITVSCTAHNPHALIDRSESAHASAFMLYTIPDFTISVSLDTAGYNAGNSDLTGTDPLYALVNMGKDFTLTATPGSGSFPAGTEFEWTVCGTTLTGSTQKGRVITISPTAMGLTDTQGLTNSVSAAKNSPTGISISCTAKHADAVADVDGTDRTVNVYRLTIPAYKITVTPPDALETDPNAPAGSPVYLITNLDLTSTSKQFTLTVEPEDSSDSFPTGTEFSWKFASADWTTASSADDSKNVTIGTMCNLTGAGASAPADATEYTIQCKAILTGAATPTVHPATETVKLKKKPPIGSKAAPDAVGDIVFNDGSAEAFVSGNATVLTAEQKAAVIAVIFKTGTKKIGLGLYGTSKKWGGSGSVATSTNGKKNTDLIKALDNYSETTYPAFYFCTSYGTAYSVPGDWYLPSYSELSSLYSNRTTVVNALRAAGSNRNLFSAGAYWSSGQSTYSSSEAYALGANGGSRMSENKNLSYSVVAVCAFD